MPAYPMRGPGMNAVGDLRNLSRVFAFQTSPAAPAFPHRGGIRKAGDAAGAPPEEIRMARPGAVAIDRMAGLAARIDLGASLRVAERQPEGGGEAATDPGAYSPCSLDGGGDRRVRVQRLPGSRRSLQIRRQAAGGEGVPSASFMAMRDSQAARLASSRHRARAV